MEETFNFDYYIALILRRRWFIIVPFCLSMVIGIALLFTLPRTYRSKTLIMVEPQRVPSDYVRPLTTTDVGSRINTISQQVMSRTNLERIIKQFGLFTGEKYKDMFLEDKIAYMRKRISINVTRSGGREGPGSFSISFEGRDPKKVMQVTNALANYFIKQNLKDREMQAVGTSKFLDSELKDMRSQLKRIESKLKKYRTEHMGELPEQLDANLSILDRLQLQLGNRMQDLKDARDRLAAFELSAPTMYRTNGDVPESLQTIEQLRHRLADLEARYTDRHPDVIRLKNRIKKLERKKMSDRQKEANHDNVNLSTDAAQRAILKKEIQDIKDDIARIKAKIKEYQIRVENTPKREQELINLQRDYSNLTRAYNSLLARKLEAEIAVNMEERQKGERFRVVDPAALPQKPVSPDPKKLFLFTVFAGLGLGLGGVFLLDYIDTSVKGLDDIDKYIGVPVLATIPSIVHFKDRVLHRLELILFCSFSFVSLVMFVCFASLSFMGIDRTMAYVQSFININI